MRLGWCTHREQSWKRRTPEIYGINQDSGGDASDQSQDDLLFVLLANPFLDQLLAGKFWAPWHHQDWGSHTLASVLALLSYFPSLWGIRGLKSSQPTGDRGLRMGYTDNNKNDSKGQLALAVASGSFSPAQNRKHPLCFYLFASEKIIVSSLKAATLSLSMYLRLSRVCFDL